MIRRIYGHKIGHMAKELELSKKDITCQKQRSKKKSLQNQLLIPIIDNSTKLIKVLNTKKKKKRNQIVKSWFFEKTKQKQNMSLVATFLLQQTTYVLANLHHRTSLIYKQLQSLPMQFKFSIFSIMYHLFLST